MVSWISVALLIGACAFLVASQVLLKLSLAADDMQGRSLCRLLIPLLGSKFFWLAVGGTAMGAVLWIAVLRVTPVSVAYPLLSLSYLLMLPAATIVFHEPITGQKLAGVLTICVGILIMSRAAAS